MNQQPMTNAEALREQSRLVALGYKVVLHRLGDGKWSVTIVGIVKAQN